MGMFGLLARLVDSPPTLTGRARITAQKRECGRSNGLRDCRALSRPARADQAAAAGVAGYSREARLIRLQADLRQDQAARQAQRQTTVLKRRGRGSRFT